MEILSADIYSLYTRFLVLFTSLKCTLYLFCTFSFPSIVFFLAVALTSSALIIERMEGLLDRSWVAGVSPGEILFSHVVTQFVVMCGQTTLVLLFMILVFGVECKGAIGWVIILTILQGLCGMCFGETRVSFGRRSPPFWRRRTHIPILNCASACCRIRDLGDLRTRKECHTAGSGQLLSHASSQRYV